MRPIRRGWDTSFCSDRHEVHTRGPLHGCTQGMGYGSTSDHSSGSVELERACASYYVRPDGRPPRQLVMQADGRGPGVALHTMSAGPLARLHRMRRFQVEHGEEQAVGRRARTWYAAKRRRGVVRASAVMPCAAIARWDRSVRRGSTSHPVGDHPIPRGPSLLGSAGCAPSC